MRAFLGKINIAKAGQIWGENVSAARTFPPFSLA